MLGELINLYKEKDLKLNPAYPEGNFYLMNGNRVLIKRELFEKFIAESSVI